MTGKQLKKSNKERIRQVLKEAESCTKLTVSRLTGLSVATCGSILNELAETGEVISGGMQKSHGGRPATTYEYNADFCYALCMYVRAAETGCEMGWYVINMLGSVLCSGQELFPEVNTEHISQRIAACREEYPRIRTVVIGLPGAVENGSVVRGCSIAGLRECSLGNTLAARHGVTVCVENDMNLRALGFHFAQEQQAEHSIAVVDFPHDTCPGAGLVVDGTVWNGSTHFAGEIAYLPFEQPNHTDAHAQAQYAAKVLCSICAIFNPAAIVVSGSAMDEARMQAVEALCRQHIPAEHLPQLVYHEDAAVDYRNGLISMALRCREDEDRPRRRVKGTAIGGKQHEFNVGH